MLHEFLMNFNFAAYIAEGYRVSRGKGIMSSFNFASSPRKVFVL